MGVKIKGTQLTRTQSFPRAVLLKLDSELVDWGGTTASQEPEQRRDTEEGQLPVSFINSQCAVQLNSKGDVGTL